MVIQGVITPSFMHHFHKFIPADANTGDMCLFHVLLAKGTAIAVITCYYSNYFV